MREYDTRELLAILEQRHDVYTAATLLREVQARAHLADRKRYARKEIIELYQALEQMRQAPLLLQHIREWAGLESDLDTPPTPAGLVPVLAD